MRLRVGDVIEPVALRCNVAYRRASPDAHVFDPDTSTASGIAEFKCPFSKADIRVETACEDPLF